MLQCIEVTSYDIVSEDLFFNQLGIVDMRDVSLEKRKSVFNTEYPLLIMLMRNNNSNSAEIMKAEIIKGEFSNNKKKKS